MRRKGGGGMVQFLLCIAAIWGGTICSALNGRLPMAFGLRLAMLLTFCFARWSGNKTIIRKLANWGKRGCYYCKLTWISASHAVFIKGKEQQYRYDAIGKDLSEGTIRQWIMDELQQEVIRYGVNVAFMFSNAAEAETRLKRIAATTSYYTVDKIEAYLREDYPERFAETVAQEYFPQICIGEEPMDIILFFPQNIQEKWRLWDFAQTFDPEGVVKVIVRHEVRHYMQNQSLRNIGGSTLVELLNRRRRWLPYGTDVMESDAFRYQFDSKRSIDAFLEEAMIEAA